MELFLFCRCRFFCAFDESSRQSNDQTSDVYRIDWLVTSCEQKLTCKPRDHVIQENSDLPSSMITNEELMSEFCRRHRKCAAPATGDVTIWWADVTSMKCYWSRACCVGRLTLLPMTRRHDAVGTANWLAEGGARGRVSVPGRTAAIVARRLTAPRSWVRRRPGRCRRSVTPHHALLPSSSPCVTLPAISSLTFRLFTL